MVHVKVLKLKNIAITFLFYLLILYFFRKIGSFSTAFSMEIVKENLNFYYSAHTKGLDSQILSNELPMIGVYKKPKSKDTSNHQDIMIDEPMINTNFAKNNKIEKAARPKSYDVKVLPSGKIKVGNSCINNYSTLNVSTEELRHVSDFKINENTHFLIYHTHTSEAYSEVGITSNFRSTNDDLNVVFVGNSLAEDLIRKNFDVLHNTTKHDTPSYNASYEMASNTVNKLFESKKYDIVLDIHRDALSGNMNFRPTTQVSGESVAKLMFVVGTNGSGLDHPNWMENLKLALLIQNTAEEMYPGLFRDLNLAKYRYNQNICDGALILEVGCTGNTLTETKNSMKCLANVIEALSE